VIRVIDTDKLEKALGKRIAQLRIAKGVSAREMSLSIGQGPAYINNIENMKTYPSMRGFFYICDYLNITPKDFFDFDSHEPEKLNEILNDMKCLSSAQLHNIGCIIKDLKNNSNSRK